MTRKPSGRACCMSRCDATAPTATHSWDFYGPELPESFRTCRRGIQIQGFTAVVDLAQLRRKGWAKFLSPSPSSAPSKGRFLHSCFASKFPSFQIPTLQQLVPNLSVPVVSTVPIFHIIFLGCKSRFYVRSTDLEIWNLEIWKRKLLFKTAYRVVYLSGKCLYCRFKAWLRERTTEQIFQSRVQPLGARP